MKINVFLSCLVVIFLVSCSNSNKIEIDPIETLTLVVDSSAAVINCNGDNTAVISAKADGGLGNYQYGLFADAGLVNEIRPYQASEVFADLPMGTYTYLVRIAQTNGEHIEEGGVLMLVR